MKRLLVIAYTFPPSAQSGSMRLLRLCRHLGKHGWDTTVLTADAEHYFLRDDALAAKIPPHVRVVRVVDPAPRRGLGLFGATDKKVAGGRGWLSRLPAGLSAWLRKAKRAVYLPDEVIFWSLRARRMAFQLQRQNPFDAVLVSSPYHSTQLVGQAVTSAAVAYVADFRDPWTPNPLYAERFAWTRRIERLLERRCLTAARALVFTTDAALDRYDAAYPEMNLRKKSHVVRNAYDEEDFDRSIKPDPGNFLLVHAGHLYAARDPGPFLDGLRRFLELRPAARAKLRVEFLGVSERDLSAAIQSARLSDVVSFRGLLPHRQALARLCEASVLVLITGLEMDSDPFIPAKVFEYLGAGRSILALVSEGSPTGRLLADRPGIHIAGVSDAGKTATHLAALFDRWAERPASIVMAPDPSTRAEAMAETFDRILTEAAAPGRRHTD